MIHGQRIPVIGNFFQITFVENPGMAFGIELGLGAKLWISIFSIAASIGLLYYLYSVRNQSLSLRFSLALILGGAFGNLIDRVFYGVFYSYGPLFYGKVVDFLDFDFFHLNLFGRSYERFPIFNVADMAVSTGVIILLLFYKKHQEDSVEPVVAGQSIADSDSQTTEHTEQVTNQEATTLHEQETESLNEQHNNRETV